MSDIVVGSVAVDIVPDVSRLRKELAAKVKGLSADVAMNADVTKVREQIKRATKTRPADIKVKLDDTDAKAQLVALQNSLRDKTLALNVSTAEAKAKVAELQAEMSAIKSGKVDLDDAAAQARIAAIQAEISSLRGKLDIDTAPARLEIAKLKAEMAATKAQIQADADTGAAEAELDAVARTRTATINTRVNKNGLRDLAQSAQNMSLLSTAALTLGPALIPILATVGALGAALAAPIALAGGGATVFAFLTGAAIKKTEDQKKQIDTLKKAVDSAKQSLALTQASAARSAANSNASAQRSANAALKSARQALSSATTAAGREAARRRIAAIEASLASHRAGVSASESATVAAAQDRVSAAVKKYQDALKALTPAQKQFLEAQDGFKSAFGKLVETSGALLLGPVTQAMQLLTDLLPRVKPIIKAFSDVFSGFLDDAADATKTQGFKNFIDLVATTGAQSFKQLVQIMGNLASAAGDVFGALAPFGTTLLQGLRDLTRKFADFTGSEGAQKGLRNFIKYVKTIGPEVGDTLGAIARAIGHIVRALAPLGPPALAGLRGIANTISKIPTPVLTGIAGAFGAIALAAKASKGVGALTGLLGGGGGGLTGGGRGGILGLATKAKPVPVFVTNQGFGGTGTGTPGTGPAGVNAPVAKIGLLGGLVTVGDAGNEVITPKPVPGFDAQKALLDFLRKQKIKNDAELSRFNDLIAGVEPALTHDQIRSALNIPELKSTTDRFDALKAHAQDASRTIDLIGPHAKQTFAAASGDVDKFSAKLDGIHDKKIHVLLDDLAAVQSLKALQALRLKDKTLTIHVEQELDRVVGPGGGQGRPLGGSSAGGAGASAPAASRGGGRAGATFTGPITIQAHDYADLTRQLQNRADSASLSGVNR